MNSTERQRFDSTDSHCLHCWGIKIAAMRSPNICDVTQKRRIEKRERHQVPQQRWRKAH